MDQITSTIKSEWRVGKFLLSMVAAIVLALLLGGYVDHVARCNLWLDQWDDCRAHEGLLGPCSKLLENTRPWLCGRLVSSPPPSQLKTSCSDSGAD